MILPTFVLPSRVDQHWHYSGIDSLEFCLDQQQFNSYLHPIEYHYNSRGFRDAEWPTGLEDLNSAVWCIGDSFTVGIGSAHSHTWTQVLQSRSARRTINVGMDGASNQWIARKAVDILTTLTPKDLIIHWSYVHRREVDYMTVLEQRWASWYSASRDSSWPATLPLKDFSQLSLTQQLELQYVHKWNWQVSDDTRVIQAVNSSTVEDIDLTIECINAVNSYAGNCNVIHSFIPDFVEPKNHAEFCQRLPKDFVMLELEKLDLARDGHHYDIVTSEFFVDQLLPRLSK